MNSGLPRVNSYAFSTFGRVVRYLFVRYYLSAAFVGGKHA